MIGKIIIVGLGGAFGSMLRYGVGRILQTFFVSGNSATILVNAIGSLLIGYFAGTVQEANWLLFLTVGFCGGFTTFSTFSLQTVSLLQGGRIWAGILYSIGSVIVCVLFAALGLVLSGKLKTM